jgi:hypothetical protein
MPARSVTLAIIAFWLATTSWLIYRDVLPDLETGEPPPFAIDLSDEVSAQPVTWRALQQGQEIGTAKTHVQRQPNRLFALEGDFSPQNLRFLHVEIRKLSSRYVVTRRGDLRKVVTEVTLLSGGSVVKVGVDGTMENGMFAPVIRLEGLDLRDVAVPKLSPVPAAGHGSVLNPLHPLNRLRGLRAGQRWAQPVMDPLALVVYDYVKAIVPWKSPLRTLHAEVDTGVLAWGGADVACWKIEYGTPEQKGVARTWVRRTDGLVLQQEARQGATALILQRLTAN